MRWGGAIHSSSGWYLLTHLAQTTVSVLGSSLPLRSDKDFAAGSRRTSCLVAPSWRWWWWWWWWGYFTLSMGHLPNRFCFIYTLFYFIYPSNLLHIPKNCFINPTICFISQTDCFICGGERWQTSWKHSIKSNDNQMECFFFQWPIAGQKSFVWGVRRVSLGLLGPFGWCSGIHSKSEKVCGTAFSVKKKLRKKCVNPGVIFGPFGAILGHF